MCPFLADGRLRNQNKDQHIHPPCRFLEVKVGLPADVQWLEAGPVIIDHYCHLTSARQCRRFAGKSERVRMEARRGRDALAAWFTTAVPKVTPLQSHDPDYS